MITAASGLRSKEEENESDFHLDDEHGYPSHVCKRQDFQQVRKMPLLQLFLNEFEYTEKEEEYLDQGYQPMEINQTVVFCKPLCDQCQCHLQHLMQNVNYKEFGVDLIESHLNYGKYSHTCTTITTYIDETVSEACNMTSSQSIGEAFFHQINDAGKYLCWPIRNSHWRIQSLSILTWGIDTILIWGNICLFILAVLIYQFIVVFIKFIKYLEMFESVLRRRYRRFNQQDHPRHRQG